MEPVRVSLINEARLKQKFGDPLPQDIVDLIECTILSTKQRVVDLNENIALLGQPPVFLKTGSEGGHFLSVGDGNHILVNAKVPPKCNLSL